MQTVIIVIHLMVVLAMTGVVLLQRSEGGGLGMGNTGGFLTSRGSANVLTRATATPRDKNSVDVVFVVDEGEPTRVVDTQIRAAG